MKEITYNLSEPIRVTLDRTTIKIYARGCEFTAEYPVRIEDVGQYLIDLMVWITFYDFGVNPKGNVNGTYMDIPPCLGQSAKPTGEKTMLMFSGGVDSTAVYLLHDPSEVVPVYCNRPYQPVYGYNQQKVIKAVGGLQIYTDFEKIREKYIGDHGFNIGIGYIAPCFPLMDVFECKYMTLGVVFEDHAFWYGEPFRFNGGMTKTQGESIAEICRGFGIEIVYASVGLSEVWTTRIVNGSHLKDLACSCCTEEMAGNLCKHCYKCFRKLGFVGEKIDLTNGYIHYLLKQKPLKMAASCVYGIQKGYFDDPYFSRYMEVDVSFLERYNDEMMQRFNTPEYYSKMITEFHRRGIEPQTPQDIENIHKFVEFINQNPLYEF